MSEKSEKTGTAVLHAGGNVKYVDNFTQTHYAGMFLVAFTPEEAYLCVGDRPQSPKDTADMHWRFACSLPAIKRLHQVLGQLITTHEKKVGKIDPNPQVTAKKKALSAKKRKSRKKQA